MDLNKKIPLEKHHNFEIQQQWVPTTPVRATTELSRRPPGPRWLEPTVMLANSEFPCQSGSSISSGIHNHLKENHYTTFLDSSSHASLGSVVMLHAPSTSSSNVNSLDCWSPLMYNNVDLASNVIETSKMPPCLPMLVQIDSRQEMPSTQNMFLFKGKVMLASNPSYRRCLCCSSHKAEYGLPATSIHNCDSLPESVMSVSRKITLSDPPTPATTEKFNKRIQYKESSLEVTGFVDEGERGENLMATEVSLCHPELKRLRSCDISLLNKGTSDQLLGVEMINTERDTKGIDLNVIRKKRSPRKKHRPKVFKEGGPSRTPKPTTSDTDEKNRWKDNTSCKRKYVWRNKDVTLSLEKENSSCKRKYVRRHKDVAYSSETVANTLGEIVDIECKDKAKSPRRCLNFDMEESKVLEELSVATSEFKNLVGAFGRDVCDGSAATSLRKKEAVHSTKVVDQVAVKPLTFSASDPNNSKYLSQKECLQQISVPSSEVNKNICALDKKLPPLKFSIKHFKGVAKNATCFDLAPLKSSSDVFQKNLNSNGMSDAPPRGKKRCHLSIDEAEVLDQKRFMRAYNFRGCSSKSCDLERQGLCLTKFHNTLIIDKVGLGKANPNFSSQLLYTTSDTLKMKQLTNNPLKFTFIDARSFVAQEKAQTSECILLHEQKEDHVVKKPHLDSGQGCLNSTSTCSRKLTPVKQFRKKTKEKFQPSTPEKVPKFKVTFVNKSRGHQSRETSEDIKSSKQAQGLPLLTMSSCTKQTYVEEHEEAHSNGVSSKQKDVERGFLSNRGLAGALAPLIDMVDIIVQKLRQLHISRCHQFATYHSNNAIVPYGRHEFMMVPYDINSELTKKRRPRAKVDLDSESNRIWNLLMGKDCSKGDEQPDVDKEKWWVEERRVFQGRVDSFIARMHLVQGDRRFSLWKGSVVDSVVGVFLTQNVSDHLSSSAFMSLAANFPLRPRGKCGIPKVENVNASMEIQNRCIMSLTDSQKLQRNLFGNGSFRSSFEVGVSHNGNEKETSSCSETLGSNTGSSITYYSRQKGRVKGLDLCRKEVNLCQQSTVNGSSINIAEVENIRLSEDVVTSQDSVLLSQNSIGFNPDLNIEADNLVSGSMNDFVSTSLTEHLDISERNDLKEVYNHVSGMISEIQNQESVLNIGNSSSLTSQLDNSKDTFQSCNADSILNHATISLPDMLLPEKCNPSDDLFSSKIMVDASHSKENIRSHLLPISCDITSGDYFDFMSRKCGESEGSATESTNPDKLLSSSTTAITIDSVRKQTTRHVTLSEVEVGADLSSPGHKDTAVHTISTSKNEISHVCTILDNEVPELFQQENKISLFEPERTLNAVRALEKPCSTQQVTVSSNGIEQNSVMPNKSGPRLNVETCSFANFSRETTNSAIPTRKIRPEVEKSTYDWESLRKEVCCSKQAQERSSTTVDSLDWEAVRTADVSKIAETIRGRGMNNVLAERIQEFLNRLVREHGSIDLEWLRDVPPDKVKDYLLSIRGLGLKSAECVRLLTLQQLAFPVDTNVGRICVRLGWVPLQPLPESLQLHLLELYPVLASIQKYLWPRLCKLDQRTLYELHYQMITFGKVFCTKSKPNCNSCPMRGECRHFASAFASARLALPAPEEKSVVSLITSLASEKNDVLVTNPTPLLQIEGSSHSQECGFCNNCVPIIEEPASPEPESQETLESAIEDAFYEDPDEIPSIKLNLKEFTQNLQNYMEENMVLQDGSLSKALVALTPEAASIPMPKLKNISRLRTEHHVFEIPDIHPLLEGLDPREPDDPSPYLLAIWTPGETELSTDPPKANCNLLDVDQPCENTCFAVNNIQEAESHKVRGTLLIPCRTAMRGSFPLNGTYFQVNEVFADHHSSRNPIYVPRDWIWNLPRRTVFFGTSIPTIFRGLTTEGIQQCFWKGFVCVRGFDRVTRAPKPLYARLHFPASKANKRKNAEEPKVEK